MKPSLLLTAVLCSLAALGARPAQAATSAASLKIRVYGVAVSLTTDCANPILIFSNDAGVETDFVAAPTLGGGAIPEGTYNCVMIHMSEVLKYTPTANDGTRCVAGTEYSKDVCRTGSTYDTVTRTPGTNVLTFGTAGVACTGTNADPVSDVVTLFLSTGVDGTGDAFSRPAPPSNLKGLKLNSPFIVAGSVVGSFSVDMSGKINDNGSICEVDPPTFSFL